MPKLQGRRRPDLAFDTRLWSHLNLSLLSSIVIYWQQTSWSAYFGLPWWVFVTTLYFDHFLRPFLMNKGLYTVAHTKMFKTWWDVSLVNQATRTAVLDVLRNTSSPALWREWSGSWDLLNKFIRLYIYIYICIIYTGIYFQRCSFIE